MKTAPGLQPAAGRWEAFALAAAAPLAPFAHAHLSPRIPPALLSGALVSYLPLQDDELLVALVDGGGQKPLGGCALTTRRVYWTDRVDDAVPTDRPASKPAPRSRTQQLVVRVADYAHLPERIGTVEGPAGSARVDLGKGTVIALDQGGSGLAAAVARYLETMATAARAGEVPADAIDPELASRAARALPDVARVTARGRSFGKDLVQFHSELFSATPHAPMTVIFIAACVLLYLAMTAAGVQWLLPSTDQLLLWVQTKARSSCSITSTGGSSPASSSTAA